MNASLTATTATTATDAGLLAVQLPGIESLPAYALAYLTGALRAWRPAPQVQARGGYTTDFVLTPSLRSRWHGFYRTDPSRAIPYLFAQGAATLLQRRLLADLGMAPGRVRHLRQVTQHVRNAEPQALVSRQRLACRLQRVCLPASGVVMVATDTLLSGPDGQALARVEDSFAVTGVDTAAAPQLQHDRALMADYAQARQRSPRLMRLDANVGEWVVGDDWGRRYAALSGQMHPVHLGPWAARLLGRRQTTLQTTALRNLVVRQLADVGLLPERLDMHFCRPVPLGGRISIVQRDGEFEVSDEQGRLAAYGGC